MFYKNKVCGSTFREIVEHRLSETEVMWLLHAIISTTESPIAGKFSILLWEILRMRNLFNFPNSLSNDYHDFMRITWVE